ncbi:MAG: PqiC family protein [Candidatus Omnitrophota bacterium]|jgi:hypothetical protein
MRNIICLSLILFLSGCVSIPNSPKSKFYTLKAVSPDNTGEQISLSPGMILGVGPVTVPQYLNRPQMVTQDKDGMLKFSEFDRWGEPLELALTRLLATNLSTIAAEGNIEVYPWNPVIPVNYQVFADIVRMESQLNGDMLLVLQWSIIDAQANRMVFTKRFESRKPISPNNYSGMVEVLSASFASFSREVAEEVSKLAVQTKKANNDTN